MPPRAAATARSKQRRRTVTTSWACNECKKRKGRCSGGEPCQFCIKAKRACEYGDRPTRTPLTRKNLDRAEAQCQALAKALKAAKPEIDVEEILRAANLVADQTDDSTEKEERGDDAQQKDSSPPLPTHDYHTRKEADGMALLSAGASRIGFLGESSASSLLASIERILMASPDDAGEEIDKHEAARSLHQGLVQGSKRITSQACRQYVDSFFKYFNSAYPLIDEQAFRDAHGPGFTSRSSGINEIVRLMVLAMGAFTGSTSSEKDDLVFYVEARSGLTLRDTESASIPLIQALALMGNYQQKRDRPNTGYMFIGMACRAALAIGLHRQAEDESRQQPDQVTEQMRQRVFWTLFNLDSGFSFTVGRPPAIDLRYITIPLPAETNDTSSNAHLASTTAEQSSSETPTDCSVLVQHSRLALISNRLHSVALTARADVATALSCMKIFEDELQEWSLSLPSFFFASDAEPGFAVASALLFWRERNVRMTMYKALLSIEQSHDGSQDLESAKYVAQTKCLELSCDTINSISDYAEGEGACARGVVWYGMYFLIHAVLYVDLAWLQGARLLAQREFDSTRTRAERTLMKFCETNPSADRFVRFLQRVRQHYLRLENTRQGGNDTMEHREEAHDDSLPSESVGLYGTEMDGLAFDQSMWIDPSFNLLLDDPLVAPLFDHVAFYPT